MTDPFELLEQLGKGGMGTVWKARNTATGGYVALKLLHSIYVDDADYVARFEREVEVSQRIVSPNVVQVLGYGKRGDIPYVEMEYVDGKSLREIVRDGGPMSWEDSKPLLRQIAEGLGAAHAAGVIHRDVKPSNIMVNSAGVVKLADFGIARAMDLTRMTGGVTMLGTPAYMSPDIETTEQSDLYGLGCVLYEMLTGAPPFVADSQQQVLMRHIRDQPDLEKLAQGARKITGWLLEKDPRRRPASAAALIGVLDGSSKITRTRVAGGHPSRWRRVLAGGVLTGAVTGIAGVAVISWRDDSVPVTTPPITQAATELPTAVPRSVTYQVSSGDTCSRIASQFSLSGIPELLVANKVGEEWCASLRAGQPIRIPAPARSAGLVNADARVGLVLSEMRVGKGELVRMFATGEWCLGQQQTDERVCYDAYGDVPAPWDTDLLLRPGRIGGLIARIGTGPWESAGPDGTLEFVATAEGALELRCNDRESYYGDNYGFLRVAVVVVASGG